MLRNIDELGPIVMIFGQLTVKEESNLVPHILINISLHYRLDELLTPAIPNNLISGYVKIQGGLLSLVCSNSSSRE
jgi:hypothetical protein